MSFSQNDYHPRHFIDWRLMVIMENGSNTKRSGGTPGGRGEADRFLAESVILDGAETGSALDYLWHAPQAVAGPQGGVLEPVGVAGVSPLLDGEAVQGTDKPCLDAALKSYSDWLESIQCD